MTSVMDEHGRVEIPRELRDRLLLSAGAILDFRPTEDGARIVEVAAQPAPQEVKLVREGNLLVFDTGEPISIDDVNEALESGRQERHDRIMGIEASNL